MNRPFRGFTMVFFRGGAKSVADIDKGGPKPLLFHEFTVLSLLFLPSRGAKLHFQLRWGPWPDWLPGSASDATLLHLPRLYLFKCIRYYAQGSAGRLKMTGDLVQSVASISFEIWGSWIRAQKFDFFMQISEFRFLQAISHKKIRFFRQKLVYFWANYKPIRHLGFRY